MKLGYVGRVAELSDEQRGRLLTRAVASPTDVAATVSAILADVCRRGDDALVDLARRYDGVELARIEVPRERVARAFVDLQPALRHALERAYRNLLAAHSAAVPRASRCEPEPGIRVERRPAPLARVGVYAPGGRAAYASSVLMAAAPARAVGVGELMLCSPPGASGEPPPIVLAAAALAGVDRVFALGGAGAIGALAFGTETVPRADLVVGPGNAWVAEAKRQVAGIVGIDAPAGPSELLVIADQSAAASAIALEAVAQAEHDPDAAVVIVCVGCSARRMADALTAAATTAARQDVVLAALAARGAVLEADDEAQALELAADYAPEHLLLAVADPAALLPRVRNAGAVFLGTSSSVVFGDYAAGGNHVLPTGGTARTVSGLGPESFVRWTWIQQVEPAAAARLADDVALLAASEGLPGHAAAALARGAA